MIIENGRIKLSLDNNEFYNMDFVGFKMLGLFSGNTNSKVFSFKGGILKLELELDVLPITRRNKFLLWLMKR